MTPLTELTKELTEFDYIKSILASLQRLEALMQASEAPRELPAPVVTVNPPDLTSIEAAIQGLSVGAWGPTASEIAAAIADVMSPLRQGDSADALREVAEGLRTLDHRMKGFGRQAYGGGTVSLAPNSTLGINNFPLSPDGAIEVQDDGLDKAIFGELASGARYNEIEVNFFEDVPSYLCTVTAANGGGTSIHEGHLHITTGTASNGSVVVVSKDIIHYRAGHEIAAMITTCFTPGVANSHQRAGLFDAQNGFFFGYEGTQFGVTHRRLGVDTFYPQGSWSDDQLTGAAGSEFERGFTPEAADFTKINVYRIRFAWLGSAPALWEVLSPDGSWVIFHRIRFPNLSGEVHITNPNLPIRVEAVNTGNTSNLTLKTNCWAGLVHAEFTSGVDKDNSTTTLLGSNATFTGGWRDAQHYASLACTVYSDQNSASNGWKIQFSDDTTTVVREDLHSFTAGSGGRTVVLPLPTKFYRVSYANGGTAQGAFIVQSKLSTTALQSPQLSLTNQVADGNQALLTRAILGGKAAADGMYYNVPVSQTTGNLKVDLAESTGEVQIKALTTMQTNQAIVAQPAVQVASSPITNRRTITFKADPSNTKVLYLGQNSSVSTGNGFPLAAGDSVDIEVDGTPTFWAISQTAANQVLAWLEVGK